MIRKTFKEIRSKVFYSRLWLHDLEAGRQLSLLQDRLTKIRPSDILLFACLRNEKFRMKFFVEYYRQLGVKHFLFVDNGSTDGFSDWAHQQGDVSVWSTAASYRQSNFGMLWLNDLLRRFGSGHWCVVVDPDEFLVYPNMETRSLKALAAFLEEERRACMHALMLDAYSNRPLQDTKLREGENPFTVCPFFDRDGYVQTKGWGNGTYIRGGVRMRAHFRAKPTEAPALNKIPFIKWQKSFHYRMSTHDAYPLRLNRAHTQGSVSPTATLFHFKMVSSLVDKAAEEMSRKEHYAGGREYTQYHSAAAPEFHDPGISVRYTGPNQLVELGLMSADGWF